MANKAAHRLNPMAASDAALASNLAIVATAGGVLESSRFDVLMGALARLGGYHSVTDPRYGGDATGASNSISAMDAAAAAAGSGGTVIVPPGATIRIDSTFALPTGVNLWVLGTLKAGAAMTAVVQTSLTTITRYASVYGSGMIDGNNLADRGIDLRYFSDYTIHSLTIKRTKLRGIRLGDTGAPTTSFGARVINVLCVRDSGDGAITAGSIGIYAENSGDNKVTDCTVIGAETGIKLDTQQNIISHCHAWSWSATGWMVTAFDDNATGNTWIACYADTPQTYGFRLRGFHTVLVGNTVYNNNIYGQDNVVVGMHFDQSAPEATITTNKFKGADSSHRIKQDIEITTPDTSTIVGNDWQNVVTMTASYMRGALTLGSGGITANSGTIRGNFVIGNTGLAASAAAGTATRRLFINTSGVTRWQFGADSASESGANAGSDMLMIRHDDAGATLGTALQVKRSDGRYSWNGGAFRQKSLTNTATWDPPSVSAGAQTTTTITVTGAVLGNPVYVGFDKDLQGMQLTGYVSAADTVTVVLRNGTAGPLDLVSGTLRAVVEQF